MYDNTCKYLAENFPEDISSWLIGERVTLTELKPTELSVDPIRADSMILLTNQDLILHLEFQTDADEVIRQLTRKLGNVSPNLLAKIEALPLERVESLGEDLLDFTSIAVTTQA